MAPIRYSLHYEDYSEHLMSRFGKLLQLQSLVDMTLMCSSHTLRVHKTVLAASSAYFQDVLQKQTGEPLIILKMRFSVLKCLVEFMYCGKTQCLEENLDELVSAAQFLKIKGLSKVTKEGLGISNHSELPVFTPPVVINRPPQSLIDLHSQDNNDPKPPPPLLAPATSTSQPVDSLGRSKDMMVRIPFDIENGGGASGASGVEYPDNAPRAAKPRRGRPNIRRSGGWDNSGALGRAAERALQRREQDSRKAIHQLKHLQTRHIQDYMERVTLSQAVNSICGPESSTPHNYMNMDSDLMYMDQTVSSNVLDPTISYSKELPMGNETITSSYSTASTSSNSDTAGGGISTAMAQYVNALKSAGLPTDLPILFESGDGSYINVNEQVLLDMVQSNEIQYEVIEQPNIIEKVADPSEIKSIDDLSQSIERGEMMMGSKGYSSTNYKDSSQYNLNSILPDNLESFAEQQNYVVLDPRLQESNNMDSVNANDFSCIDGDMQFFTKSMSDDVKKYYEEHQLNDARVMEHLCPTSTALDTNFNISMLDAKNSHLSENMNQQYNPLNPEDLRRNEDCYDFGLQLPQSTDFKEDTLDCLMATPKRIDDDSNQLDKRAQERDEIIQDLMNIEKNMSQNSNSNVNDTDKTNYDSNVQDFNDSQGITVFNDSADTVLNEEANSMQNDMNTEKNKNDKDTDLSDTITSSGLQWDNIGVSNKEGENSHAHDELTSNENDGHITAMAPETPFDDSVTDLAESNIIKVKHEIKVEDGIEQVDENDTSNKENIEETNDNNDNMNSMLENDIPFAVGLLPLRQVQPTEDASLLKRKSSIDDLLDNVDAKCLKRKVKYKKL